MPTDTALAVPSTDTEATAPQLFVVPPPPAPPSKRKVLARGTIGKATDTPTAVKLLGRAASGYKPRHLEWMWPDHIPSGKATLLTGKPDCGKSLVALAIATIVSSGRDWPDCKNTEGPQGVMILAAEDDVEDTLVPRLMANGANLDNIYFSEGVYTATEEDKGTERLGQISLLNNDLLEAVAAAGIKLLIIDPLISFMGGADANRDKDVRPIMDKLKLVCDNTGLTVVGIVHTNKKSDQAAIHRVSGAGSIAAAARAVWACSRDTETDGLYHMAHVKGNLSKNRAGIDYTIVDATVHIDDRDAVLPRIEWGGVCEADADDLLAAEKEQREKRTDKQSKADVFLAMLKLPLAAREVYAQAEEQGLSADDVKRAKGRSGNIKAEKTTKGWMWLWADQATTAPKPKKADWDVLKGFHSRDEELPA